MYSAHVTTSRFAYMTSSIFHDKTRTPPWILLAFVVFEGGGDTGMADRGLHGFDGVIPFQGLGNQGRAGGMRCHAGR